MPEKGDTAPDFILPTTHGPLRLSDVYQERKVVLAFYAEDSTPGCAQELGSFREEYATIQELGAEVVAVSVDSMDSHRAFCDTVGGYPFPLASDQGGEVGRAYRAMDAEGKRSRRSVYVIEQGGRIVHHIPWYQPGNPAQLLEVFRALGLEL